MQINVPPIPAFQIPGTTGTVVGVGNIAPNKPVKEEGDAGAGGGGAGPGSGSGSEQREVVPTTERRDLDRRSGQDRRKQQLPVLLDTRVGERRRSQRREEDPAPSAVDFKV